MIVPFACGPARRLARVALLCSLLAPAPIQAQGMLLGQSSPASSNSDRAAARVQAPPELVLADLGPREIDYLPYVTPEVMSAMYAGAGGGEYAAWPLAHTNIADDFEATVATFVAVVDAGLQRDGLMPALLTSIRDLPERDLNRMVLNSFARRGPRGFLERQGTQVAFVAKLLLDRNRRSRRIRWAPLQESMFPEQIYTDFPLEGPLVLSCNQFIAYSCFTAGLPPDRGEGAPVEALQAVQGSQDYSLVDPRALLEYGGWFRPELVGGGVPDAAEVELRPGDLLLVNRKHGTAGSAFIHVEVVTATMPGNPASTMSVGNSGEGPHHSRLLGVGRSVVQGVDAALTGVSWWRTVPLRFQERELPDVQAVRLAIP